jgi:rhodanese-related sulfurtransferase/CBS domain-containing protein
VPNKIDTQETRRLVDAGAQLVDVLPHETYVREHLPGAINLPLADIAAAVDKLDRRRPVIVYCYDHECDLSPRAAARLEQLGFDEVYDYAASSTAWFGAGLPSEGLVPDSHRAVGVLHSDVPRVGPEATIDDACAAIGDWDLVVMVDDGDIVLGVARRNICDLPGDIELAAVMQSAPRTVRPSITVDELASSMGKDGEHVILVTTSSGELLGLVRGDDLAGVS